MIEKLRSAFQDVKEQYFPHWDKNNSWVISINPPDPDDFHAYAQCDLKTRTIYFDLKLEPPMDYLITLLIHEISHAVTKDSHGNKWKKRYLKVSEVAVKNGYTNIAENIRRDLYLHENIPKLYADTVYSYVKELVKDDPEMTLEEIFEWISWEVGIQKVELIKKYKKIGIVFETEKARLNDP